MYLVRDGVKRVLRFKTIRVTVNNHEVSGFTKLLTRAKIRITVL